MPLVVEAADLDAASVLMSEQYASMRLSSRGERHRLRIVQEELGRVRLDRVTLGMQFGFSSEPMGALCVGRVRSGRFSLAAGQDELYVRQGDVFLAVQPDVPFKGKTSGVECDYAIIEPGLLDEVAQNGPGVPGPVRLLGLRPLSPQAGAEWTHTFGLIHTLVTSPLTIKSPLVTAQASRLLVAATLAAFPNTTLTDPTIEDRHDAHPATLHRAVAFIEEHPQQDMTVTDIARAARVSVRALQLAFRRHLDTTPMRCLRGVRLRHAHEELRDVVPGQGVTVTSVAARWGFSTPARFSTLYRQEFGLSPVQTLWGERRPIPPGRAEMPSGQPVGR
ncbi:helix-turn-helix transcriptional regulator [Streptomyces atriruber]|uniref:Helix-turn-helix transcriptional regulator n=1 Tax=Streptomyces atriruber TaxID=545121 RepID=A0ABV3BIY1_9ACTN